MTIACHKCILDLKLAAITEVAFSISSKKLKIMYFSIEGLRWVWVYFVRVYAIVNNECTITNHMHISKSEVQWWPVLSSSPILCSERRRKRFLACLEKNREYLVFAINSLSQRILIRRQLSIFVNCILFCPTATSLTLLHFYYTLHC